MSGFAHVAIDGPAGSGKTTVARELARRFRILFLDTGVMYRALALLALRAGVDPADEAALLALAEQRPVRVVPEPGSAAGVRVFAGDDELGDVLYSSEVSQIVSRTSAHPAVRQMMVERQRAIAAHARVVMAGRDIGTVVLPEAPIKVFLTASVARRVERRLAELRASGSVLDGAVLQAQIEERDRLDEGRAASPLRPAEDAVEIDSSALSVEEVVGRIAGLMEARA